MVVVAGDLIVVEVSPVNCRPLLRFGWQVGLLTYETQLSAS